MTKKAAPVAAAQQEQAAVRYYVVTNDRIGHPVGTVLEFDHEPHELFLRCLSLVQEEAPE